MVKRKAHTSRLIGYPLAHTIIKTRQVFNWADILAFNICLHMKNIPGMKKPCFYMEAYLIDAICSSMQFPDLGGIGTKSNPPFICISLSSGALTTRDIFMTFVICSSPPYTLFFLVFQDIEFLLKLGLG
jgi:hypothetical protein